MEGIIRFNQYPVRPVLKLLITDKTTKRPIIFGTRSYEHLGDRFKEDCHIEKDLILGMNAMEIQPRVLKDVAEQTDRTRKKAEVMTPSWIVNKMNNHCDEEWFGYQNVFNTEEEDRWITKEEPIRFPETKTWQQYVDSVRMEITCGEAPYLVSRYDTTTGEVIPLKDRIGILDRKLRVVGENTKSKEEWLEWAIRTFQATYGYEYQGDNLLLARINLLITFVDYMEAGWGVKPTNEELRKVANIIGWNIWQMDGLKGTIPLGALYEEYHQMTIFEYRIDDGICEEDPECDEENVRCRIYDWRGRNKSIEFIAFRERRNGNMKFDFIIGNPPYQDETIGDNKGFAPPIYDKFMEASFEVAEKVELIHPARFLFNAGSTPKAWNQKMLQDPHFTVLHYEQVASKLFPGTDIKGGVAVSYHDAAKNFGAIEVFSPYDEINTVRHKVTNTPDFTPLSGIMFNQTRFDLTALYEDHPEYLDIIGSNGKDKRFRNNIFDKVALFSEKRTFSDDVAVLGVVANKRTWRYIPRKYVDTTHENLFKWKVLVVRVNGTGALGEVLSTPVVSKAGEGYTQTFIGIGAFDSEQEASNALKYVKTKFLRTMLSTLKITQDNSIETWRLIPLQDFTTSSDIDWSQPTVGIDRQLYSKYGLSDEEIAFIETNVKEME